ncbi:MAG: ion transporter [Planctomycetes bacterium]|jgi:voltage-gated sodium channel|nr:ion transporter [Planctomycetota bacterium]
MTDSDLLRLQQKTGVAPWRIALAAWVESARVQHTVIALILINAAVLGMEATPMVHSPYASWLVTIDHVCLGVFVIELLLKAVAYRWAMLRSGWNVFDILVVGIALVPASGPASVLRGLRVLRVFRLLTAVPSMRRVVSAFLHAIPGLGSVMALMSVFFYVAAVMATGFFGATHPEWFGHLGRSLYTLFQIMTLESWSMGIVRPVMATHPWAWAFFVPFIIMATFTILNLFIGIIVSTMQELSAAENSPKPVTLPTTATAELITRLERDLAELRRVLTEHKAG